MEQFNTGEAAIGTGSYKLREWVTGSQIVLERPPADIGRLKTTPEVNVIKRSGERIMMLTLDSSRDVSPFVTDTDGKALFPNPLRDWRVRKAITKAINRDALVDRLIDGVAVAACIRRRRHNIGDHCLGAAGGVAGRARLRVRTVRANLRQSLSVHPDY